jgi:predicted Rossmann fold flavoprotein
MNEKHYDVIIIGSGGAGMMSAITASKNGKKTLLLEKLKTLGSKLKATGGGKWNLTNTLDLETFMQHCGKNGRFMTPSLRSLDQIGLREFFKEIGVETHTADGFRVFPKTHKSDTILEALQKELDRLGVEILCEHKVDEILVKDEVIKGLRVGEKLFFTQNIIVATGGLGYPDLGTTGDGFSLAKKLSHTTTKLFPAMLPLKTKESWVENCRADTIAKVTMKIDLKKYKKLKATGDLIFTKNGIRGPVVLDFAREITPLLEEFGEVAILVNLTKGLNEEQLREILKSNPQNSILTTIKELLPEPLSRELCKLCGVDPTLRYSKIDGQKRDLLIKTLANTPLTIIGHDGFKKAMITRGGISLKEVNPDTLQSKRVKGLYFCGEVLDLDGPCGGYNLQWSFSSGALAGELTS